MWKSNVVVLVVASVSGCTQLGPMPATTGISAIPAGRGGIELQGGLVPGYYLSDSTQLPQGTSEPSLQLAALYEPGSFLPGLVLSVRSFGEKRDYGIEPLIGYRRRLNPYYSIGGVAYAAHMGATIRNSSYEATRGGGEFVIDAGTGPGWAGFHAQLALAATYVSGEGSYCVDSNGTGRDCDSTPPTMHAEIHGLYPTATVSLALDLGRHDTGYFHGLRLALLGSMGEIPQLRYGTQLTADLFRSVGLTLTIGVGED